jgi:hypothetical protein
VFRFLRAKSRASEGNGNYSGLSEVQGRMSGDAYAYVVGRELERDYGSVGSRAQVG